MIRDPVIVLGAPRSGTTMLYHTLARSSHLWSLGGESNRILEGPFEPGRRGWVSNEVGAGDLDDATAARLRAEFERTILPGWIWRLREARRAGRKPGPGTRLRYAMERWSLPFRKRGGVRLLEKSPRNCLRVPMLGRLFPDARFVLLRRDGRATVSSLMDGWRTPGHYESYALPEPLRIPGYDGSRWSFVLPPGWRDLVARPLEEVCARQWVASTEALLRDLPPLRAEGRVHEVAYEDLAARPRETLEPLLRFLRIPWEDDLLPGGDRIPVVNATSPPAPDKWKQRNGAAVERILPIIAGAQRATGYGA